jgi:cytosine/adenosine deaminase-related metal-dependent hydrolase
MNVDELESAFRHELKAAHHVFPGLINAHDHLEFALFPRLGAGPYPNAAEWAADIYHPERPPVREHLRVSKDLRMIWGGLRNLLAGVTTVGHHNPYAGVFDENFPVRVARRYGWAHSFAFATHIGRRFSRTPLGAPFIIHLAEGTDASSAAEIYELDRIGALAPHTVLVHAVGIDDAGWHLLRARGSGVVWCPRSNCFSLGRTLSARRLRSGVPVALATDSPLTATGDLLDEIAWARRTAGLDEPELLQLVGLNACRLLRVAVNPADWIAVRRFGEPPKAVVIGGTLALVADDLAREIPRALRRRFFRIEVEGRPPVRVRWNVPRLLAQTRRELGADEIRLGGRLVAA